MSTKTLITLWLEIYVTNYNKCDDVPMVTNFELTVADKWPIDTMWDIKCYREIMSCPRTKPTTLDY